MRNRILLSILATVLVGCDDGGGSSSPSQGGSMARFAIAGDYLYTINQREMNILDIKDATTPKKVNKIHVPFDVETLFAYGNNLYVGSSSGLYIYDKTTPTQPTRVAMLQHIQSCDPVVVSEDVAYVTLHSDSSCWQGEGENRLEIIDVKTPDTPKLIKAVDMWEPKGLGVDGKNLFICDGSNGLRVYDIDKLDNNGTVSVSIDLKDSKREIDCYDVIANNKNLVVSNGKDIRQFDYRTFPMEELGRIK